MKDYQVSEKKMTQTWGVLDRQAAMKLAGTEIPREAMKAETGGGRILAVREEETRISREKYLEVTGVIYPVDRNAPNIEWKILLPFCWNRRSVQVGGGANNGQIPALEKELLMSEYNPAEHGFVVFGDDSGHQSRDPMSADFASNEEALQNYIRLHLIKTNGVMHFVVKKCYGEDAERTYFVGGSAGGREALECAVSYGKDYDGIFCADPASSFVLLRIWGALLSKAVYDSYEENIHPYSDGFIDEKTVAGIQKDAIEWYDELDGIRDGIVSNIYAARANRHVFIEMIREKYHLTEAQLHTIEIYEKGFELEYAMPNGVNTYHGCSALEGGIMDLGPDPVPREPLDTRYNVHHGDRSDGVFKYFITKDKNWKLIAHDYRRPDPELYRMLMEASLSYDVNQPELDDFIAHGGKMILFTSWNDMSISPWQIISQYQGYVKKYGQEQVDRFLKFYCMPSATHCSGIFMDYLEWLDTWCTTGIYPSETLYGKIAETGGEMPMAEFPGWVRYTGGDPKAGTSYEISYEIPEGFFEEFA